MKPKFIGYEEERAYLTKWEWGDLPEPTDAALREPVADYKRHLRDALDGLKQTVALQAATVVFDQIAEDAKFDYCHQGQTIDVWLVEGMLLTVPLRQFLLEATGDWSSNDDPEDGEPTYPQRLAALLREVADEIEGAEERNGNRT
jgi:uncharacterized circularly permuted ATP-grasp superfamily protein